MNFPFSSFFSQLLADFTVSLNSSRVSVVTYSSVDRVMAQIDHISDPSEDNHKCNLMEAEIPGIGYSSGGTYTLGALAEAQRILQVNTVWLPMDDQIVAIQYLL